MPYLAAWQAVDLIAQEHGEEGAASWSGPQHHRHRSAEGPHGCRARGGARLQP